MGKIFQGRGAETAWETQAQKEQRLVERELREAGKPAKAEPAQELDMGGVVSFAPND